MAGTVFYASKDAMASRFGRPYGLGGETLAEFPAWKERLRRRLAEITGMDTPRPCPPNPRLVETERRDGYERRLMLIDTEPGVTMPFYALVPDKATGKAKAGVFLAFHGHCGGGKAAVAGVAGDARVEQAIDGFNYAYAERLARRGLVVLAPDARGFGQRREASLQGDACVTVSSCAELNALAVSLGQSVIGLWTWDNRRLIDYAETMEEADPSRIGCGGLSGGGMQALWCAAMDDRIRCAAVSGYFYGYRNALFDMLCCPCNYAPGLFRTADMGDLAALVAPRPLFVETGSGDSLNGSQGLANVESQTEIARRAYALHGREDRFVHEVFEGGHRWHGVGSEPWIAERLGGARA